MSKTLGAARSAGRAHNFVSTRGESAKIDFRGATLAGLAKDGGLYVPEAWPRLSYQQISALKGLSYTQTAFEICRMFVGDTVTPDALHSIIEEAYATFDHSATAPLKQLDAQNWLLELFHGPTLAFKDIALQVLARFFDRFLGETGDRLTILAATSGDTGSAAIRALADSAYVDVIVLHPKDRVTDIQRRQMTTVIAPNVHNIAVEGTFDDAQALVKTLLNDQEFARRYRLSAINSINWARLMAQVVYYFYAAVRLGAPERSVAFSIPSGNFGNAFAGYVALQMGLPVAKLVVATNVNDILHRALSAGDYSAGQVHPTASPSMDIQVCSNFERLLFDIVDRDPVRLSGAMRGFEQTGRLDIGKDTLRRASGFSSCRVDEATMASAMQWAYASAGELIDPHTAIGLAAARQAALPSDIPVVTLATAHPAKFRDTVKRVTGRYPDMPARLGGIEDLDECYVTLPPKRETIERFVAARIAPSQVSVSESTLHLSFA